MKISCFYVGACVFYMYYTFHVHVRMVCVHVCAFFEVSLDAYLPPLVYVGT